MRVGRVEDGSVGAKTFVSGKPGFFVALITSRISSPIMLSHLCCLFQEPCAKPAVFAMQTWHRANSVSVSLLSALPSTTDHPHAPPELGCLWGPQEPRVGLTWARWQS